MSPAYSRPFLQGDHHIDPAAAAAAAEIHRLYSKYPELGKFSLSQPSQPSNTPPTHAELTDQTQEPFAPLHNSTTFNQYVPHRAQTTIRPGAWGWEALPPPPSSTTATPP